MDEDWNVKKLSVISMQDLKLALNYSYSNESPLVRDLMMV